MRADAKMFVEQAMVLFNKAGISFEQLARDSGINRTSVYRLFTGKRDYVNRSTAVKIAKALGGEIEFDGEDLPSGIYFYRLTWENASATKKMILLK